MIRITRSADGAEGTGETVQDAAAALVGPELAEALAEDLTVVFDGSPVFWDDGVYRLSREESAPAPRPANPAMWPL